MSTEIAEQSFAALVADCSEIQKDYLVLLVKGIDRTTALGMIGRNYKTWKCSWSQLEKFAAIEEHIKENKGKYLSEVQNHFSGKIAAIEMGLVNLASKVAEWDKLERVEKGHVLRACAMVRMIQGGSEQGKGYEERLKEG